MNRAHFRSMTLCVLLPLVLSACAIAQGNGTTTWKEEALLHDGRKVIVERTVERGGRREVGQQPPIKRQSLSFNLPGSQQRIVWEDAFAQDLGSASFLPMLLDVHNATAYLVAQPMGCLSYNKWGRPNPPYVVFRHDGRQWSRAGLQELPAELKAPNLIFSSPDDEAKNAAQPVVSAENIKALYGGYRQPEFKSILRRPIANSGGEGCGEKVSTGKGGWLGIDWFNTQPNLEACLKVCTQKNMDPEFCPCQNLFKGK